MKISALIERAINTTLWDGQGRMNHYTIESHYSCIAINLSMENGCYDTIVTGLDNMGVNIMSTNEFLEFRFGPERQYARALWLTWAALMAKEQGL